MPESDKTSTHGSTLILRTSEAFNVCHGKTMTPVKKRVRPPSAFSFGISLNTIWFEARRDDPYAEFSLICIEEKLNNASLRLNLFDRLLERDHRKWPKPEGLSINVLSTYKRAEITVDENIFRTPHAMRLIVLIGQFDSLTQKLLKYRQLGIITNTRFKKIRLRATRYIRAIMYEPRNYKKTGITRKDIANRTEQGTSVLQERGMLPLTILTREQRSELGPTPLS